MKSLKKKRRVQVIAISIVALIIVHRSDRLCHADGINYFRSPSQVAEEPPAPTEVFRIGGLVEEGSLVRGDSEVIRFNVTDGGAVISVSYTGVLPDLFGENQGMVALGSL